MGLTVAESQATLDARFPTTGGGDYLMYSEDGSTETANLPRLAVGATGWAAATAADPSVKANANILTTAAATGAATISHFAVIDNSTGGTQRTDWQALTTPRTLAIGDKLEHAVGDIAVTLT